MTDYESYQSTQRFVSNQTAINNQRYGGATGFQTGGVNELGQVQITWHGFRGSTLQAYTPAPKDGLPGFPEAGKGAYYLQSKRWRWRLPNGGILEWDKQHGEVEKYDRSGKNHDGAYDPATGEKLKPGNPGRTTPKFSTPNYDGPQYTPSYHPMLDHNYNNAVRNAAIGTAVISTLYIIETYGPLLLIAL